MVCDGLSHSNVSVADNCRTTVGLQDNQPIQEKKEPMTTRNIVKVDASTNRFEIRKDLTVAIKETQPGPPQRISGKIRLTCDSCPNQPIDVEAGESCVIPQGEWHRISLIEKAQLIHITPGPGGDVRAISPD